MNPYSVKVLLDKLALEVEKVCLSAIMSIVRSATSMGMVFLTLLCGTFLTEVEGQVMENSTDMESVEPADEEDAFFRGLMSLRQEVFPSSLIILVYSGFALFLLAKYFVVPRWAKRKMVRRRIRSRRAIQSPAVTSSCKRVALLQVLRVRGKTCHKRNQNLFLKA